MTKEQAIVYLRFSGFSDEQIKAIEGAFSCPSAVLDEIRAEIEKEIVPKNSDQYDYEAKWQNLGLRMALKVIDKYKAEGGDKE